MKKRVLVIGGNGFIGKNVMEYLREKEYCVGGYDLNMPASFQGSFYEGDIIHDDNLDKILSQYNTVIYLISAIMPKQSMEEPLSSYTTDVPLLIKTLETCKSVGIKRIIYASSGGTVYGDSETANNENMILEPINHYAICKVTCEKILMLYNQLYEMENVALRISNPYGKYQRVESGVGAVAAFTTELLKGEKIVLWGDGENARDFVDIKSVAKAFHLAVEWEMDKTCIPVFNIGSGERTTLNHLIQIIADEMGVQAEIDYQPKRNFDVRCNYLDIAKAKAHLGYSLDHSAEANIREYVRMRKSMK